MRSFRFYCLLLLYLLIPYLMYAKAGGNGIGFTFFPESKGDRFNSFFPHSLYLEPGIGAGLWHQSDQLNMRPKRLPLMAFLEISKDMSPLSYGISFNIFTSYSQRDFVINPEYASLYTRYSFSHLFPFVPSNIDVYAMGGLNVWRTELRDERDPAFRSAKPLQFDNGLGWMAGVGIRYYLGHLGVGVQWNYFNAQGKYQIADEEERVDIATGSAQVQFTLSYRFRLDDSIKCPTFR